MKKLIAIMLTTIAATQAFAQGPATSQTSVTVKRSSGFALMPAFSVGATQFTSLSDYDNQAKAGTGTSMSAGVLGELGRGSYVFQSGLLYMRQSSNANINSAGVTNGFYMERNITRSVEQGYLAVPLAMKARARIVNGVRLTGRLGAMPAFLLSNKVSDSGTYKINGTSQSLSGSSSEKEGVRDFNIFAVAGFGPEFAITRNQNLRVEIGYERSLLSLAEKNEMNSNPRLGFHSLNLMLSYAAGI